MASKRCLKVAYEVSPHERYACVKDEGHSGECSTGGECCYHGEYTNLPNFPAHCPECQITKGKE